MFVETVFESSFGFTNILFGAVVALYHVFGVTVNVMSDNFWFRLKSGILYEVCPSDMYLQVRQFFPHRYEARGCCVV